MLVHFIGGPAHGRTEPHAHTSGDIRYAVANAGASYGTETLSETMPYEEHVYRITRHTPRYCIAEWQPPKVAVRFSVKLVLSDRYGDFSTLQRYVMQQQYPPTYANLTTMYGRFDRRDRLGELDINVKVDGPADATALQLGAELVQRHLDRTLPDGVVVLSVDATTN